MLTPTCFGSSLPQYRILHFTCLPPWTHAFYHTCLPYFNSLYILLLLCYFNSCTSWCYYIIQFFYSTQGALHTDSYLLYILDKPPYRSVFSCNSDGSRSSLKMADYCQNMKEPACRIKQWCKLCALCSLSLVCVVIYLYFITLKPVSVNFQICNGS
jgi:hypothetical protein